MPSLVGLFARKSNKSSSNKRSNSNDTDSAQSSPTADYVTPDRSTPSSPNGRNTLHPNPARGDPSAVYPSLAASSSKLRFPFTRKKGPNPAPGSTPSVVSTSFSAQDSHFGTPPRPQYFASSPRTSLDSDMDTRRLKPPPSKSAIFAAYGDPHGALSTRSLPNASPLTFSNHDPPPPVPPKKQKPGFFNWSRSSPSSPATTLAKTEKFSVSPTQLSPTSPPADSSFNLKSFRHVGRPPAAPNASAPSLTQLAPTSAVAIPRTRGESVDSSQRISVAAFREAQARRSAAGSPVPSIRSPSPAPLYGASGIRPGQQQQAGRRRSGLAFTSGSEEESEEEDDSDSDQYGNRGIIKQDVRPDMKSRATKSEVGHGGISTWQPAPRSPRTASPNDEEKEGAKVRPPSILSFNVGSRPRASVSTSAATPTAAAKRASVLAAANAGLGLSNDPSSKRHSRATSASGASTMSPPTLSPVPSNQSQPPTHARQPAATRISRKSKDSDSSSEEDDTPLATLLPPRRPGSALSSNSSSSNPIPRANKPLIDINQLLDSRPKPTKAHTADGFTGGGMLGKVRSPTSIVPVPTSVSPPRKFISPPSSPTLDMKRLSVGSGILGDDLLKSTTAALTKKGMEDGSGGGDNGFVSTTSGGGGGGGSRGSGGSPKDGLGERLARVVQLKGGSGFGSSSTTSTVDLASSSQAVSTTTKVSNITTTTTPVKMPTRPSAPTKSLTFPSAALDKLSPPEDDLAAMLGAGVHLIRAGDSASEDEVDEADGASESSESSEEESDGGSDEAYMKLGPGIKKTAVGAQKTPAKTENEDEDEDEAKESAFTPPIAPIAIKQRAPPISFSVTSRPPLNRPSDAGSGNRMSVNTNINTQLTTRQRSSTLVSLSSPTTFSPSTRDTPTVVVSSGSDPNARKESPSNPIAPAPRQRSSTLISNMTPSLSSSSLSPGGATSNISMPRRPFAAAVKRQESPASSTGDSSSGRVPFTPKDGSEVGSGLGGGGSEWSGGASGLGLGLNVNGKHIKRRSVSFEENIEQKSEKPSGKEGFSGRAEGGEEERRKERRRSEAKAAIELGNVINGRGPVVDDDDDDDDLPINQTLAGGSRMSTLNPVMMGGVGGMPMGFGPMAVPARNMSMPMHMNMMGGQNQFTPLNADPNFIVAHQQAMMYAKQAYQMAVAQQAMAAAGDDWERGSVAGGFGGSVYGGGSPSVVGVSPYGMGNPMMNMSPMGMGMGNGWSTGSMIFPGPSRSSFFGEGISAARSEYGGGARDSHRQWNSAKSSYGESFGPSRHGKSSTGQGRGPRDSYLPPMPPLPPQHGNSSSPKGNNTSVPRPRTTSQPATPGRGARKAPPSSWKAG